MSSLTAITGGIGSGKSVVSRILRTMGYPVYDSDTEAKAIMDNSTAIKEAIAKDITPLAVKPDGSLDRAAIAAVVFKNAAALACLNNIVHTAVREHLSQWVAAQTSPRCFVETAILFESKLNTMVQAEWRVVAPEDIRIQRVMARNGISEQQVKDRIAAQTATPELAPIPPRCTILNDYIAPVLPQILRLLQDAE